MSQISSASGRQRSSSSICTQPLPSHGFPVPPIASDLLTPALTADTSTIAPLYDARFEHDACGTGLLAHISGERDHHLIEQALTALANLGHRGAMDADAETSDGAGILTQLPYRLLADWLSAVGQPAVAETMLALGMVFLPRERDRAEQARAQIESALRRQGARLLGWRVVPMRLDALGGSARQSCPRIEQVVIRRSRRTAPADFERALYLARKDADQRLAAQGLDETYIASLSAQTVVYKGLVTAAMLPHFYPDLLDPAYESALAVFHQRYSTNTFPSWPLAQPFRLLAHNGEINTVQGNRNWMAAREETLAATSWGADAATVRPIIEPKGSDSTSLDNALELLVRSGRTLPDALTLLIPEAWEGDRQLSAATRAFFQARAPLIAPWDGPAALTFSDGRLVGAALDRNGLRPLRYALTNDGLLVVASEAGVVDLPEASIVEKGRLGPGQTLVADTARGVLLRDADLKATLAAQHPYAKWVRRGFVHIGVPEQEQPIAALAPDALHEQQTLFGYSHEDVEMVLRPTLEEGKEPVWSMGDDTPLAVFSQQPRPLSTYFKQRFAQVTNPPIDSLREQLVMSLTSYLGARGELLADAAPAAPLLELASPVLDEGHLQAVLATAQRHGLSVARLSSLYTPGDEGSNALSLALDTLEQRAVAAVRAGASVLVVSDRTTSSDEAPMPVPLGIAAVHAALVRAGLRLRVGIIAETGGAWDVHQVALLIGYGANAVCPYLALATVRALAGTRGLEQISPERAAHHYRVATEHGLLKVLARMGLSALESYLGSHLFECIGVEPDLIARYCPGTPHSLGGLTLADLDQQVAAQWAEARALAAARLTAATGEGEGARPVALRPRLTDRGYVRYRRNAEYHANNPLVVKALQQAAQTGEREAYRRYAELVYSRPPTAIRDLLTFRSTQAIALEQVEPASEIVRRFVSTAMSLGALSPEAHLTLTLGVNRLGARSNTGEGGEDPAWQVGTRDGVSMNSRVKQIASGRFGVTTAYLAHAEELEIKMAQGSKPGEGGQLPARKVTPLIARLRHTEPGIPLISPPPHHDIYSIEDLAQLIYDLKQVNPRAAVGVKLVAERGVGTIAAGVAKAHADYILISGHDGGTGASPLSSIKNAGIPWEVGLAETQQVLRLNGLRGRVRLRTDGGLKTGRDVVIAALLGADEYGFGTAGLIALGCDMARQCHLDTCPTGIATQREDLRQKFTGRPEHLANFLLALAEEVREILAALGARTLDEVIGRADLLVAREDAEPGESGGLSRRLHLRLEALLAGGAEGTPRRAQAGDSPQQHDEHGTEMHEYTLLDDALPLLERGGAVLLHASIRNADRAVGARLAGAIAQRWGDGGLPHGNIISHYTGSAGQSFGAFCVPGLRMILVGEANDYVAKGMTGGEIVVMPPARARFVAHEQIIMGNTVLYGATGGVVLVRGRAGERFAVRNGGAVAVVEGVGDHACEYMTGGAVVVLGQTGRNFAAGMSGGIAYVYDKEQRLPSRLNGQMVQLERITDEDEAAALRGLIAYHESATGSDRAAALLDDWPATLAQMWRIVPQALDESHRPWTVIQRLPRTAAGQLTTPESQRAAVARYAEATLAARA